MQISPAGGAGGPLCDRLERDGDVNRYRHRRTGGSLVPSLEVGQKTLDEVSWGARRRMMAPSHGIVLTDREH